MCKTLLSLIYDLYIKYINYIVIDVFFIAVYDYLILGIKYKQSSYILSLEA